MAQETLYSSFHSNEVRLKPYKTAFSASLNGLTSVKNAIDIFLVLEYLSYTKSDIIESVRDVVEALTGFRPQIPEIQQGKKLSDRLTEDQKAEALAKRMTPEASVQAALYWRLKKEGKHPKIENKSLISDGEIDLLTESQIIEVIAVFILTKYV